MSHGTRDPGLWGCLCGRHSCSRKFQTVQELKRELGQDCTLFDGGLETLNRLLPELYFPVGTTSGAASVLSERGRFSPLQFSNMKFSCQSGEVCVRTNRVSPAFESKCLTAVSDVDHATHRAAALHVFSDDGQIIHRIDLPQADDAYMLEKACGTATSWDGSLALLEDENRCRDETKNVIALSPYLNVRQTWPYRTVEDHLDEMIADGGKTRLRKLGRLLDRSAWKIEPSVLPRFFEQIVVHCIACTRVVPQPTLLQAGIGVFDHFQMRRNIALLQASESVMALDLSALQACWVVNYGELGQQIMAVELYDHDNSCMGALFVDVTALTAVRATWHELLNALPRA